MQPTAAELLILEGDGSRDNIVGALLKMAHPHRIKIPVPLPPLKRAILKRTK